MDHEFTKGGVFTEDQIKGYAELKWEEIHRFEHAPHPVEFEMYYSSEVEARKFQDKFRNNRMEKPSPQGASQPISRRRLPSPVPG